MQEDFRTRDPGPYRVLVESFRIVWMNLLNDTPSAKRLEQGKFSVGIRHGYEKRPSQKPWFFVDELMPISRKGIVAR